MMTSVQSLPSSWTLSKRAELTIAPSTRAFFKFAPVRLVWPRSAFWRLAPACTRTQVAGNEGPVSRRGEEKGRALLVWLKEEKDTGAGDGPRSMHPTLQVGVREVSSEQSDACEVGVAEVCALEAPLGVELLPEVAVAEVLPVAGVRGASRGLGDGQHRGRGGRYEGCSGS